MITADRIILIILLISHFALVAKVNSLIDVIYLLHTKIWQFIKGQNNGENRTN